MNLLSTQEYRVQRMLSAVGNGVVCAYAQIFWLLFLFFVPNFLSFSLRTPTRRFITPGLVDAEKTQVGKKGDTMAKTIELTLPSSDRSEV